MLDARHTGLHAHYAHYLAGGDNPVGEWTDAELLKLDGGRTW